MDLDSKSDQKEGCNIKMNMTKLDHYKILAEIFRYPDAKLGSRMQEFRSLVADQFPEFANKINLALETFNSMTMLQQQEYYLKTFDVQAVCYLDIGYVMFGEDYKRAQLLVNLQSEHVAAGVDCGTELADHLPNVLMLFANTADRNFAEELGFIITIPAVRFMLTKFRNINNYYKEMLEVLLVFLQRDFDGDQLSEFAIPEQAFSGNKDFLLPSPKSAICDTHCNKRKSF